MPSLPPLDFQRWRQWRFLWLGPLVRRGIRMGSMGSVGSVGARRDKRIKRSWVHQWYGRCLSLSSDASDVSDARLIKANCEFFYSDFTVFVLCGVKQRKSTDVQARLWVASCASEVCSEAILHAAESACCILTDCDMHDMRSSSLDSSSCIVMA